MLNRPHLTGALVTSLVAIALAVLVLLVTVPSFLVALVRPGASKDDPSQLIARHVDEHKEAMQAYEERFKGRYLFFKPPPPQRPYTPPPPPPPPPDRNDPPPVPVDPGPPPPPSTYPGPPISAIVGDIVWFQNKDPQQPMMIVKVGEEKNGVRVISTDPPRSVRVATQGGEYDVPLFPTYQWNMPYFASAGIGSKSAVPGLIEVVNTPAMDGAEPVGPALDADAESARGVSGVRPGDVDGSPGNEAVISREEFLRQAEEDGRDLEAEQEEEAAARAARRAARPADPADSKPREP